MKNNTKTAVTSSKNPTTPPKQHVPNPSSYSGLSGDDNNEIFEMEDEEPLQKLPPKNPFLTAKDLMRTQPPPKPPPISTNTLPPNNGAPKPTPSASNNSSKANNMSANIDFDEFDDIEFANFDPPAPAVTPNTKRGDGIKGKEFLIDLTGNGASQASSNGRKKGTKLPK